MLAYAAFVDGAATVSGLTAALVAVGGFIAHARPALSGADERRVREATVVGGLGGLVLAALAIFVSFVVL